MVAVATLHLDGNEQAAPVEDHFVHFHGVSWADYLRVLKIRGDHSAPRITYCEGVLEIMSPAKYHESIKSRIGRLGEVFCLEREVEFETVGSWTLQDKKMKAGAEPDESYIFGAGPHSMFPKEHERPDLAIEVVWTWGGIDKLEVYAKLGVREVWYYERGKIQIYQLRGQKYARAKKSRVLPGIDLTLLVSFLDRPTTSQAIREYRKALQGTV